MTSAIRLVAVVASLAFLAAACHASADYRLGIDNGTTLDVTLVVNGTQVATVPSHEQQSIEASTLPALPWTIQALSPTGRVLLETHVDAGVVWATTAPDGHTESHSAGTRVDLSCGRLDVFVGAPMIGPMPGPGVPGDCDP